MKKLGIVVLVILFLFIGIIVAIPLFFKDSLQEKTISTLNKQINADINFSAFHLSVFSNFPNVTLELKDVLVIGKGEFQSDTLVNIPFVRSKMSLMSLFKKEGLSIDEIILERPKLNLLVADSGIANWDLAGEQDGNSKEETNKSKKQAEENTFQLQLENVQIKNGSFYYFDKSAQIEVNFENIDFDIRGKMYGNSTELLVDGGVERFSTEYEGIKYISNVEILTQTLLQVDYRKMEISILENEITLNRLPLQVTGTLKIPSDSMFFDMNLKSKESGFDNFFALIPAEYEHLLKEIETSGSANITGKIKGLYFEENYPSFSLNVDVKNGKFKYIDLPEEISNINADISIVKPQGILDLTEVNIKEAHAEIKNNPVDLTLKLNRLMSDPFFDGLFIGKVNFNHLKDALPLDSVNIAGIVDANLFVKGKYSAIENEEYEKINSNGVFFLDNFRYDSPDLTQQIIVPAGKLDFTPEKINLSEMLVRIGNSEFNLAGDVTNYLNYIFKESTLKGDLRLVSPFVNLNELLLLQVQNKSTEITETAEQQTSLKDSTVSNELKNIAFDIPENIDFTFRSSIRQAIFDRINISDINGLITAKNGTLILNGLKMNLLDGELSLNGSYRNTVENQPFFDFGFAISSFDIPKTFQSISGFQRMLPGANQSSGKINTSFKLSGRMDQQLKVFPGSLNGNGLFNTENLKIVNSPVFNQLDGILKAEKLKNVVVDDFNANFTVSNGNLLLKPFTTKIAGQETKVEGSLNAQNLLNMRLDFNIERDAFGTDIQNILSAIPGNRNIRLVPAGVLINGPVGNPEVKMDLSETKKTITNAAKDDLKNSLDKIGKGLLKLFEK